MQLVDILVKLGFSEGAATFLSNHDYFRHKRKTEQQMIEVFRKMREIYGCGEQDIREAVLKFPPFAGYDHKRVVEDAVSVYGDENGVKKAVLKFPQFASLDHKRVVRERVFLGDMAKLTRDEVIQMILEKPVLAGYSQKRYIAGFDVGRTLAKEGFKPDKEMVGIFFRHLSKSPYVPGTKRKRPSEIGPGFKEPPLMKAMRKSLVRLRK